jgi:predicted transposase YbfD/YdcC
VIVDGKKVRHGGVEIVNAVDGAGRFLGSVVTAAKSNEIPAARQLLRPQNLIGKTVIGDALHTQTETAQQILYEQGGDYLLTVKANQKTLQETLQNLFAQQALSPSAHGADLHGEAGTQPRPLGDSGPAMSGSDPGPSGLSGSPAGGPLGDPRASQGQVGPRGRLLAEQSYA